MVDCNYSVVIPCYGSRSTIKELVERLTQVFEKLNESFEVICVDDYSPDMVWEVLVDLRKQDERVRIIRLFRNYGQHQALLTGFRYARGHYIITMDDDLQHPPEEIPKLIKGLAEYDAVVGAPTVKHHSKYKNLGSLIMRSILQAVFKPPQGFVSSAFRLMRAPIAKRLAESQTVYPYISGMILEVTRNVTNVEFAHQPRRSGKSGYSVFKLLSLASNLILNYTKLPLQLIIIVGLISAVLSGLGSLVIIIKELCVKDYQSGWPSLVVIIAFFGGLNLISLSVIGEYIIRILNQISVSKRPLVREAYVGSKDSDPVLPHMDEIT